MRTRFCMVDGEPRAFTNRVQYVNGTHRGYKMLFDTEGLADVLYEDTWQDMLLQGRIAPIGAGDPVIEKLSDAIGEAPDEMKGDLREMYGKEGLTPQEALDAALQNLRIKSINERVDSNADRQVAGEVAA